MEKRDAKIRRKDLLFPKESYDIKAACIAVHDVLGCGFLEKVYEKSLAYELQSSTAGGIASFLQADTRG